MCSVRSKRLLGYTQGGSGDRVRAPALRLTDAKSSMHLRMFWDLDSSRPISREPICVSWLRCERKAPVCIAEIWEVCENAGHYRELIIRLLSGLEDHPATRKIALLQLGHP